MADDVIPPQQLARIDGAVSDTERANAMIAGATAPDVLSFDPRSPHYDPVWCARLRSVRINDVEQTDVVSFDIPRGVVEVLLRDVQGKERHEYLGDKWDPRTDAWPTGRLAYKTELRVGTTRCPCGCGRRSHVSVQYGIPIERAFRSGDDRRTSSDRRR